VTGYDEAGRRRSVRKTCAHQTIRLFSSGHLVMIPIAVASGFTAGTAPLELLTHLDRQKQWNRNGERQTIESCPLGTCCWKSLMELSKNGILISNTWHRQISYNVTAQIKDINTAHV